MNSALTSTHKMIERKSSQYNMEPEYLNASPCKSRKCSGRSSPRNSLMSKKRVRFAETSIMILTEKESIPNWYSKQDIKRFRYNAELSARRFAKSQASNVIKQVAYSVMSGTSLVDCNFAHKELICGLEHMVSPSLMKALLQRRKHTVDAVMQEQELQSRSGENDVSRLALASMKHSAFTKEWRRRLACLHMTDNEAVNFYSNALVHSR